MQMPSIGARPPGGFRTWWSRCTYEPQRDVIACNFIAELLYRGDIRRDGSIWAPPSRPPLRERIRKAAFYVLLYPLFLLFFLLDQLEGLVYGPGVKRGGTVKVSDCHFYAPVRLPERKARQVRARLREMGCFEPHVQKR